MVHTEDSAHFFSHSAAGEGSLWDFLLAVRFIAKAAASSLIDGPGDFGLEGFLTQIWKLPRCRRIDVAL